MSSPEFLHGILTHERPLFGKVVNAVLDSGLDHRPDPKSRSAGELVGHLIGHPLDIAELLEDGVIHHRNQVEFASVADGAKQLDDAFALMLEKLGAVDEARWGSPGKFMVGDQLIAEAPCGQIAWMLFLDMVHHRGQLSTHLRAMGSRCPGIYGPSADEMPAGH